MSTEVNRLQSRQNQDLQYLQEQHRRRRDQTIEQNEEDLRKLREGYQQKEQEIRKTGETVVNHIRSSTDQRIAQNKEAKARELESERARSQRAYEEFRRNEQMRIAILKKEKENLDINHSRDISLARQNRDEIVEKERGATAEALKKINEQKQQVEKANTQEINKLRENLNKEKSQFLDSNSQEIIKLNRQHQNRVSETRRRGDEQYANLTAQNQKQLDSLRTESQTKFEKERTEGNEQLHRITNKINTELEKHRQEGDKRIQNSREEYENSIKKERERQVQAKEETRSTFDKEISEIHHRGETEVERQKLLFNQQLEEQKKTQEAQREEQRIKHDQERKEAILLHRQQMERIDQQYRKIFANQKQEFQDNLNRNLEQNRQILDQQRDQLIQGLTDQKREAMEFVGKYRDRQDDPFFHLKKTESILRETPWSYVFEVGIPEEQKDEIKVMVKEDRLIVSGNRRFNDGVEKDGRKIITNSYQTFREEIPLSHPAIEDKVTKEYDKGKLRIHIPKVGVTNNGEIG